MQPEFFKKTDLEIKETKEEECDCRKCITQTERKLKSNKGQVSINGLMHLLKDPAEFILKAADKPKKSSNHLYDSGTHDPNKSKDFQMFIFTRDEYQHFTKNKFLWENCLFEEMTETQTELEGRALLLIMEILYQADYQEYLLNCRDILKKIKGVKGLTEKMQDLMIELETPILEDTHKTEEFVMLRDRKNKLRQELIELKEKNAIMQSKYKEKHGEVLIKISQWWKLSQIVSDIHNIKKITLAETLSSLRKSITKEGIEIRRLGVMIFDKLCFSLESEERALYGLIIMSIAENSIWNTKLGEYIKFFKLEHSRHWNDQLTRHNKPIFRFNNKMNLDPIRLYESAAGTADSFQPKLALASVLFPKLDRKQGIAVVGNDLDRVGNTNESQKRLSTNSKILTDTESTENFSEESSVAGYFGEISGRKNHMKAEKLRSVCLLENNVTGLKGAFIQIKKFENQFLEWLDDYSRPIWEFNFILDGKRVGPLEMLILLKALNTKKYLLDMKVLVGWYFSFYRQSKANSKKAKKEEKPEGKIKKTDNLDKSESQKKKLDSKDQNGFIDSARLSQSNAKKRRSTQFSKKSSQIELKFEKFTKEELTSLSNFSKSHYSEGWKILELLGQLKQNLIENIKDETVLNNKYFLEILPQKGVPMLIKFAQYLNQQYSTRFINSSRDLDSLQEEILECIETNRWLILDLHCLTPRLFEEIERCCRLRKSSNQSSLHTFQLFIVSDPERRLYDNLAPEIRMKFRYYKMKMEITFTELSVLATRCFGGCLMVENMPQQTIFENYIDLFISPMFGKTIHLNYDDL